MREVVSGKRARSILIHWCPFDSGYLFPIKNDSLKIFFQGRQTTFEQVRILHDDSESPTESLILTVPLCKSVENKNPLL